MRVIAALCATLIAVVPLAAVARDQQQLDCPVAGVPAGLASGMVDKLFVTTQPAPEMFAALREGVARCADRFSISQDLRQEYFTYALARLIREELAERIARAGVPAGAVDKVADFGPGRSNPVITAMSDEQGEKLVVAVAATGVDVTKLTEATWNLVGGYIGAASQQYASLRKLE